MKEKGCGKNKKSPKIRHLQQNNSLPMSMKSTLGIASQYIIPLKNKSSECFSQMFVPPPMVSLTLLRLNRPSEKNALAKKSKLKLSLPK